MTLQNKVVIITGASQGLGKTLAEKLAKEGARVMLVARSVNKLKKITSDLQKQHLHAQFFACDITDRTHITKTVESILQQEKTIDILINNAGIWTDNEIEKTHPERRKEAFDTNALGTIEFTQAVLPYFKEKNSGYIFTVISTSGISDSIASDSTFWQSYAATKWALTGFTNALRNELAKTHIKVTGFFPGGIDTNLYENAGKPEAHNQAWMMKAEDITDIIIFALTRPSDVVLDKIVVTKVF
ncbi:MAG: SDR family oxidoreductase [Patescibacteria group bacterium]|nr:SDR family oxidoreductase [Patescibacteria group bacterium]